MQNHFDLNDDVFEKLFETCELSPDLFNHEAHLRLAWIHIEKYGLEQAIQNIENQLKKFVAHVGAKNKYHQTLTIVAVRVVHHFAQQAKEKSFQSFIQQFPDLKNNFKQLINSHYTYDVFNSEKARILYQEPDADPFV